MALGALGLQIARQNLTKSPPKRPGSSPSVSIKCDPVLVCHGNVEMSPLRSQSANLSLILPCCHGAMLRPKNEPVKSLLDSPSSGFAGEKKDTQKCPKNHEANPYHKVSVRLSTSKMKNRI